MMVQESRAADARQLPHRRSWLILVLSAAMLLVQPSKMFICQRLAVGRGRTAMRGIQAGGGEDRVRNVSPEIAQAGMEYAQRYEDLLMGGRKLWQNMKAKGQPKKFYIIGTNGNKGNVIGEAICDSLGYVPDPNGDMFMHRKSSNSYPPIVYDLAITDKMIAERSDISPIDLFIESEEKYRDLEHEVLKEFAEMETQDYPQACIVGEGAVLREENNKILKDGVVIWLDADPGFTWSKIQMRGQAGMGIYIPPEFIERPPLWAIAAGWDGDIDDTEGKLEYSKIVQSRREIYDKLADVRLRMDIPGIQENPYWAAEKIVKALKQLLGELDEEDDTLEEEVIGDDLTKFLEGARLTKYQAKAEKWCSEMGAASIDELVENVDDFSEAMGLKPLEVKRLQKAAAAVAASAL